MIPPLKLARFTNLIIIKKMLTLTIIIDSNSKNAIFMAKSKKLALNILASMKRSINLFTWNALKSSHKKI